jgi:hypothetical protein
MKVNTKKTRCPNCQKLVIGRTKSTGDIIEVFCPSCNEAFWHWDGTKWLQIRK